MFDANERSEHEKLDQRRVALDIRRSSERANTLRGDADAIDQGIVDLSVLHERLTPVAFRRDLRTDASNLLDQTLPRVQSVRNVLRFHDINRRVPRAFDPEEDLIEMRDGMPVRGTQKTTTARVPSSAIRRSGHRLLGLNPKDVCASGGLSGRGWV